MGTDGEMDLDCDDSCMFYVEGDASNYINTIVIVAPLNKSVRDAGGEQWKYWRIVEENT